MPEMMFPLEITRKKRMKKASRRVVSIDNTRRDAVNPQNSRAPIWDAALGISVISNTKSPQRNPAISS